MKKGGRRRKHIRKRAREKVQLKRDDMRYGVVLGSMYVPEDELEVGHLGLDLGEAEDPGRLGADGVCGRRAVLVVRGVEDADALRRSLLLPN